MHVVGWVAEYTHPIEAGVNSVAFFAGQLLLQLPLPMWHLWWVECDMTIRIMIEVLFCRIYFVYNDSDDDVDISFQ